MSIKIKNEEDLHKKLELWKKTVSKEMKGEHFDLTNDSGWSKNVKEIKTIINNLKNAEKPEEVRKHLTRLFKRGKKSINMG